MSRYHVKFANGAGVKKVKHAASMVGHISDTSKYRMMEMVRMSEKNRRRLQSLAVTREMIEARKAFEKAAKEAYERAKEAFEARKGNLRDGSGPSDVAGN